VPEEAGAAASVVAEDITDGSSNTILVMQASADRTVIWTKPEDLEFDVANPLQCLATIPVDTGLTAGMADRAVRWLPHGTLADQFKALVTPAGNEVIDAGNVLKEPQAKSQSWSCGHFRSATNIVSRLSLTPPAPPS
jgi:hypothetical protein